MSIEFQNDNLILYIEEVDDKSIVDMQIFVLFDKNEEEFYITGVRNCPKLIEFNQFKFYCKTVKQVANYILSIVDDENKINYTLYNFPNIYDESDIDYYTFKSRRSKTNEIIGYDRISYNKFEEKIISLLSNLKYVRY
uniref:Uncharacterized protein n=1 Tax=viral metagenome TaxID=1070528 RepID=A0A6C0ES86_9ZZZZ